MIERIINRVVDAVGLALAAIAEVERGDAEVLQKRGVVGAGAKRCDAQVCALARFAHLFGAAV